MMSAHWPDLPAVEFFAGRTATEDDIADGRAVFSMAGQSPGSLSIEVPQYAYWIDEMGDEHPMIVVQAEQHPDGTAIIGLRSSDGSEAVATLPEVKLLGKEKPAA
jgi:hypothetical protein